jgi:hypothetical protein
MCDANHCPPELAERSYSRQMRRGFQLGAVVLALFMAAQAAPASVICLTALSTGGTCAGGGDCGGHAQCPAALTLTKPVPKDCCQVGPPASARQARIEPLRDGQNVLSQAIAEGALVWPVAVSAFDVALNRVGPRPAKTRSLQALYCTFLT